MRLSAMRYKDYVWPHNPETFVMEYRRRLAAHRVPYGRCVLQDMGTTYRVLRGEGTFAGADAYREFEALERVFRTAGAGTLIHPVWKTDRAYFASLTLREEPRPDYVRYSFEFWEDDGGYGTGFKETDDGVKKTDQSAAASAAKEQKVYVVKKGDTLWAIAKRYGVTLASLIAANPQIKNPNLIYPGNEVKIP